MPKKPNKILFVAVEVAPFVSVGGLSQVMYYLPKALQDNEYDIRVFMPKFGLISEELFQQNGVRVEYEGLRVPVGVSKSATEGGESVQDRYELICNVKSATLSESGIKVYFLENMEYYELRANVYGYADDPIRWGLFQRGVLEFLKASSAQNDGWVPDVIHCNDWQTGLIPNYYKTVYAHHALLSNITTVFTIHNLAHQGNFNWRDASDATSDDGKSSIPESIFDPRFSTLNSMRRGIMYADAVNTVSKKYSREILTPEFGEGLDQLLIESRDKLRGILNGIDYIEFSPEKDKKIRFQYNEKTVHAARFRNKKALQEEFGLPEDPSKVVLGISYRLTGQKGVQLILDAIASVLAEYPVQLVVNGDGDGYFKDGFKELYKKFPTQVGLNLSSNFTLPRMIFAGADIMLLPSLFEPCGIVQMEAMRYGCVPVARAVGGLADTVQDSVTGFIFKMFEPMSLFGTIVRALEIYKHPVMWKKIIEQCMRQDFSWGASARQYAQLYETAVELKKEAGSRKANVLKYTE